MTTVKEIPELNEFDQNRFWANVRVEGVNECWEWADRVNGKGYGRFFLEGKEHYAHRIAYFLKHGPIPEGKKVLHSCDNASCVNPNHLFSGTQKDNMYDMIRKGRASFPPAYREAVTEKDVFEIRERCSLGETQTKVARDYDISQSYVSDIVNKKAWAYV